MNPLNNKYEISNYLQRYVRQFLLTRTGQFLLGLLKCPLI